MRYVTAGALRTALERRLLAQSLETRVDLARLRRRVVFERLMVRFAQTDRWIVKGAAALEVRVLDSARMTRDLDLALLHDSSGDSVREALVTALRDDPDSDLFEFRLSGLRAVAIEGAPEPVSRASIDCRLDGRTFDRVSLDIIVASADGQTTESIRLPGTLEFAGIGTTDVQVIDRNHHFAEKLHAFARKYGDRPSTRVKDLADLVLLVDTGLEPSPRLVEAVERVFKRRGSQAPAEIPDAPSGWEPRYEELAEQLALSAPTVETAVALLRKFWAAAGHGP